MTFEQDRDTSPIDARLLTGADGLPSRTVGDALLALITSRYTQSNSIAVVQDGMTLGIGAGQQNRLDCVRMAVAKARLGWLRRHGYVRQLPTVTGMKRQDRLNWQIRFAEDAMTVPQRTEFVDLFGAEAARLLDDTSWRKSWAAQLTDRPDAGLGRLPSVPDKLDYAAAGGVTTAVEPGGSIRIPEVHAAAAELRVRHLTTAQRLFHH